MLLDYVPIDQQGQDIQKTKVLFETAFPEDERPPFSMMLDWNHDTFYGVYRDGTFLALVDLICHQDLVYVFFLAIEEENRGQGIGSQILSDLKTKYSNRRLFLLAEETDPKYPDNETRKKRLGFYAKNGFLPTGDKILEYGVMYELLTRGGKVTKSEFVATMASLIGEENARRFYARV